MDDHSNVFSVILDVANYVAIIPEYTDFVRNKRKNACARFGKSLREFILYPTENTSSIFIGRMPSNNIANFDIILWNKMNKISYSLK